MVVVRKHYKNCSSQLVVTVITLKKNKGQVKPWRNAEVNPSRQKKFIFRQDI